jgi:cardiolipin synthase
MTRRVREQPRRWRQKNVPRRWRTRLAPDPLRRRPKGLLSFWVRARRLLWSWWPWAVATIAALVYGRWGWAIGTGIVALGTYVAAPAEAPPHYGLDHEFSVDDDEFLATIAGATGETFNAGNRITLLNNGDEFYPAMLDDIAHAEASITIEAYIYWAGEIGVTFAKALAAKSKSGIRVKILLDAVGSATVGDTILKILEAGGCQLAWYNPLRWYTIGRVNHRTHRKSIIVDGRIGFTGGAGIADQWRGHAEDPAHWRDMQVRIEGPAVAPLQTGFAQNWLQTTGELLSGGAYYPPPVPAGPLAAQTIMSSPEIGASTVRIMYYLSIICARRSIYIANPYFLPDAVAIESLLEARRRGVDVQVMVSGIHNDNWWARHASVRLYGRLLEAGVGILEYNHTMLHHKTMVVDGVWSTIGTSNFDNRSFAHNEENNVCVYDRGLARSLEDIFRKDTVRCARIDLPTWRTRSLWAKGEELIAALLQDQA